MATLRRILVPTDFSALATRALDFAADLARTYGSELHLLHVFNPAREIAAATSGLPDLNDALAATAMIDDANRRWDQLKACAQAHAAELPAEPIAVVRPGVCWDVVTRYAAEKAIDLIVLGSRARGVVRRIMRGSTSEAILEHAACPVLLVPVAALVRRADGLIPDASRARHAAIRGADARMCDVG